jgi:hypothetical protein
MGAWTIGEDPSSRQATKTGGIRKKKVFFIQKSSECFSWNLL